MKKFFTLCAAFAMVMGVSAAPQLVKKATPLKASLENKLTRNAGQKIAAPGEAYKLNNTTSTAMRAKAEVIESTYDEISVQDYGSDTWFIATSTDGAYKWYFNPAVAMTDIEFGKVYTMDDMLVNYTYAIDMAAGAYFDFAELECVITEDWKVECNVVAEDGREFHVYYKELELPTELTDFELPEMNQVILSDFRESMGVFQFQGFGDNYEFGLCFESPVIEGSYDENDCYGGFQYTYVIDNGVKVKLFAMEADITKINDTDYALEATYCSYNGIRYILHSAFIAPTVKNTETITATDLVVDDSMFDTYLMFFGYGVIEATAAEGDVYAALYSYSGDKTGVYSVGGADLEIGGMTIKGSDVYSGSVELAKEDGAYTLKGEVLCWNSTLYTLDLEFQIPEIEEERTLSPDEELHLRDLIEGLGGIQICNVNNTDANWYSFVFDCNELKSQHFDQVSEAYSSYCYFVIDDVTYEIYTVDLDLTVEEEEWALEGQCQAGAILWNIEFAGGYEEADPIDPNQGNQYDEQSALEAEFSLEDIDDFEVSGADGYAYLRAINAERNDMFATLIYVDSDELAAGTYPISNTYEVGTAQPGDCNGSSIWPTFYGLLDETGQYINSMWLATEGTVTVSYDADGYPSIICEGTNSWGYDFYVTVNADQTAISNVAAEAQKNGKFMEQNNVVIRNNGKKFNGFGMMIK